MAKKAAKKSVKKAKAAPKKKAAKKSSAKKSPKKHPTASIKKEGELTISELAKQEKVSSELVRNWCRDGRIKARLHKSEGAKRGVWLIKKAGFKRPTDNRANNGRKVGAIIKPKKAIKIASASKKTAKKKAA